MHAEPANTSTNANARGLVEWVPVAWMLAASLLSYIDRQALAILSPTILAEIGLSAERYAQVVSAFSITYMLGNPLWGTVIDRIGLRRGMLIAVALWSVASAAHSLLATFVGFAVCRALLGAGEGATFPGGLRTSIESLPERKRGRGLAIAYSGGSLGAILTPLIVVPIAARYGWRAAFLLTGAAGIAWLIGWHFVTRMRWHSLSTTRATSFVWPNPRERRFWALVASYALGAAALAPVLYLAPLFLGRVHGLSQMQLGRVLWIPPLGWELGYFFWGAVIDRYAAREARPVWLFAILAVLSLPFGFISVVTSTSAVLALMFIATFAASGYIVASLRSAAHAYPKEQSALIAGIGAGAWSALVAVLLPLLGHWFDARDYRSAFAFVALIPAVGTAAWAWLTPRRA